MVYCSCMRNIIYSTLVAAFTTASAMAEQELTSVDLPITEYDFPACVDHTGTPVQYIDNDTIDIHPGIAYIGVRYLKTDPISQPAIIYKRDFLHQLSPFAFDFTMAHECYHLQSGDAFKAYLHHQETGGFQSRRELQQFEDDADCYAAHDLIVNHGYNYEQVREGINAPNAFGRRLSMSDRAALILECAQTIS